MRMQLMKQNTYRIKSGCELIYNPLEFLTASDHRHWDDHYAAWKRKDNTLVICSCQNGNFVQSAIYKQTSACVTVYLFLPFPFKTKMHHNSDKTRPNTHVYTRISVYTWISRSVCTEGADKAVRCISKAHCILRYRQWKKPYPDQRSVYVLVLK